jgi:hypothetical protein
MANKGRARSESDTHIDELWETYQDGGDPADLRQGDGIRRQGPDRDRAAECGITTDLPRLLHTGGQLEDPADDLY